mgnify:CR=1 FL=1
MNKLSRARLLFFLPILIFVSFFSGCGTMLTTSPKPLPESAIPPVVAVSQFENRSNFSGQWKLGSGMSDLLVSELVNSKNFIVVEREYLGTCLMKSGFRMTSISGKKAR